MLTEKQAAIRDFIERYSAQNGFPPSVREIGRQFGIYPATVQDHIAALEKKGYLQRKRFQSRTLSVPPAARRKLAEGIPGEGVPGRSIPVVGRVAAGLPLLAQENVEDMIQLPQEWAPAGAFLLKVQGNSMEGAHILDGDYVLVHPQRTASNGDIVVALIGEEATVKRFYRSDRGVVLKAENPKFEPIEVERNEATPFSIVGKVMGVLRVMKK
jgi:repressor LexA